MVIQCKDYSIIEFLSIFGSEHREGKVLCWLATRRVLFFTGKGDKRHFAVLPVNRNSDNKINENKIWKRFLLKKYVGDFRS